MSKSKVIIEVSLPEQGGYREVFYGGRHTCTRCHGQGRVINYGGRDAKFEVCPQCKGSGEVQALVTVDWSPVKEL